MLSRAFTTRPVIEGKFGVVASTHWLPTAVGMRTLECGGDARGDTVRYDIIDRHGNMVSSMSSSGWLQSSPSFRSSAFASAHVPDCSRSNRRVRPRSTLSPTMALRDGATYLAWVTPGGDQQDQ